MDVDFRKELAQDQMLILDPVQMYYRSLRFEKEEQTKQRD